MNRIQYIKERLGQKAWFLILLPIFFLLHMVTEYHPMLTLKDLFIPVTAWLLGIPVLGYVFFRYIKPSWAPYAVLVYYFELIFYFFSPIKSFFDSWLPAIGHYKYLSPLLLAIGACLYYLVPRKKAILPQIFLYLNTLLIILLVIECSQLVIKMTPKINASLTNKTTDKGVLPSCDSCLKPDVYFIIFDGYSGSDALQRYWHYDNSALDSFFHNRGFFTAAHSTSNYNYTSFSIGSTLNMDYHKTTFKQKIDLLLYCKGIKSIENNAVCRLFQQLGYTIHNQSFFPVPGDKPHQSISYLSNKHSILMAPVLSTKLIADLGWKINASIFNRDNMQEITANNRSSLQQLKNTHTNLFQLASQKHNTPVFVYAHFMLPHSPYLFDSTGKAMPETTWFQNQDVNELYLSQLKYTNTFIKNMVTQLQKPGSRPRVIIVQSDHGFRRFPKELNHLEFSNLNAIYFHDRQYAGLYDSISSVNTFRVILRKYFNASLPLLKDSTVYIRH